MLSSLYRKSMLPVCLDISAPGVRSSRKVSLSRCRMGGGGRVEVSSIRRFGLFARRMPAVCVCEVCGGDGTTSSRTLLLDLERRVQGMVAARS